MARKAGTLVDVLFTVWTSQAGYALTGISIYAIFTGSIELTRVRLTLVYICLASFTYKYKLTLSVWKA